MKNVTFLAFFLFIAVSNNVAQIVGKYAAERTPYAFEFYSDSTFKYEYKAFHNLQYSKGKWSSISKNVIFLNSDIQQLFPEGEITSTSTNFDIQENNLFFLFTAKGETNAQDFMCEIVINDTIYDKLKNGALYTSGKTIATEEKSFNINNIWEGYFRCDTLNSLKSIKIGANIKTVYLRIIYNPIHPNSIFFTNKIISTKRFIPNSDFNRLSFRFYLEDSLFFYNVFINTKVKVKPHEIVLFHEKRRLKIMRAPDNVKIFIRD